MKRARVLVIGDGEVLALFGGIQAELDILCAATATTALELLGTEHLDVVVNDVATSGLGGRALLRRVEETGLELEVILITTACGTRGELLEGDSFTFVEYLAKPFDAAQALAAIEAALVRRHSRPTAGPFPVSREPRDGPSR